ncbi:MAG: hypothetical protein SNJ29_13665 [Rikenellaceae bacterium]
MRNLRLNIAAILSLCIMIVACSKEQSPCVAEQNDSISVKISHASIATRSDGGDMIGSDSSDDNSASSNEESSSFFVEGDQITVVGAATETVTFTLNADGEWISINPYEWVDSPQTVSAYFGKSASVADGDQMPDLYYATMECNGEKPEGGVIAFEGDQAFKHTAALIRVQVNDFESTTPPTVQLYALHQISYVNSDGTYQKDSGAIYSINFELTASEGVNHTFEAKIPSGEGNLLSDYQLKVGDENIFNYIANTLLIPTSFDANKIYTFTVNYTAADE